MAELVNGSILLESREGVLSPDDVDLWYFDLEEETSGRIGMCN
jgi:hypothetical protein